MAEPSAPRQARNRAFEIAGAQVAAGTRRAVELPVAPLPTDTSLSLSVMVVNGLRPGPTLWLSGVIHGDELNGIEIIRQVLRLLHPRSLAGTVLAVPIVNVFGFLNESRYLPDRRDLNRSFPGSPRGSLTARLAHRFTTEIVGPSDAGIDFHTGSDHRTNLPQLRVELGLPGIAAMAEAFAAPVTLNASQRDGSLRSYCARLGKPILVYEGGEANRFNEAAIKGGVDGTLRVLSALDMWSGEPPAPAGPTVIVEHSHWERAHRSGIVRIDVHPGQRVERGEVLGIIAGALGDRALPVRASTPGIVLGYTRHPMVSQGDALVHVADTSEGARGGVARTPSR
ncbi:MAG TPA: succinylglutamate desuccinylase/aspartoacylase family protein [Acidimicrobiales bacterium]|nr:succinylglutamate desuccinylase/aspartoacylase family protein [Acidimicrobiales bacterium]